MSVSYAVVVLVTDKLARDGLPEGVELSAQAIVDSFLADADPAELAGVRVKVVGPERAQACFESIAADASS